MLSAATKEFQPNANILRPTSLLLFVLIYAGILTYWLTDTSGKGQLYFLMLLQVTPLIMAFATGKFTFLSFILFAFFVRYSLAKVNEHFVLEGVDAFPTTVITTFTELTYCSVLIIISYYSIQHFFPNQKARPKYESFNLSKTHVFLAVSLIVGRYTLLSYLPVSVHNFYNMAADMAIVILFCSKIPSMPSLERIIILGASTGALYNFLLTGSLRTVGVLVVTLFVVSCLQNRKKTLIPILLLMLLMCAIQSVKYQYRLETRKLGRSMSTQERALLLTDLLYAAYIEKMDTVTSEDMKDTEYLDEGSSPGDDTTALLALGMSRVGENSLERVLEWTPERVPFWKGETYANIPYLMIPRFLWPNKPSFNLWNKFGRVYGFLSSDDRQTSVAVNFLGEAYMNFGFFGMYICACLFGILVALAEKISTLYFKKLYAFTFIIFLLPLLYINTNMGPILQSLVIITLSMFILRSFFKRMATVDVYE